MKKILIAGALLAALGVAQAQAVSGVINYDFKKQTGSATTSGIADAEIDITATEDLGAVKVTAGLGLNGNGRGETLSGTDAYVSVASPAGTVTVGQLEVANGLKANTFGLAPVMGTDGTVLAAASDLDVAKYTSPAFSGFTASVAAVRGVDSTGGHTYVTGVAGDVGPVKATADYTNTSKRVRVSGSMDLGAATIGAGWSGRETNVENSWAVAFAVPMGPVTVGAVHSRGDGRATELGSKYALSKRTSVNTAIRKVTENSVAANNATSYRVRLSHTF